MRKFLIGLVILLILLGVGGAVGYRYFDDALQQTLNIQVEQTIDVPSGISPSMMFIQLEKQNIIKNAWLVRLYWRIKMKGRSIHTGEYLIKPGMKINDLIKLWLKGEVIHYKVMFVEGWNIRQVRATLAKQQPLKQTIQGMTDEQLMEAIGEKDKHPEGQFFPDTYLYIKGDSDLDILRRAHKQLVKVLDNEWQHRAQELPYENAYQALIMASIIEKETGVASERPQIAGVFVRRLQKKMLLQTDPTVIYGMGEDYNGRITRANLKNYTPYNTYVISGLPPTPIAMVGQKAIYAALHPLAGETLYFVAKGDGSHEFSSNLTDHNNAVKKYQMKRRADYRSSPPPIEAN